MEEQILVIGLGILVGIVIYKTIELIVNSLKAK